MNQIKTTPKDFFLHLGATIALYASVIAIINLLFSVINYVFPDNLAGYFYANTVAWPISMLVVLVPVLYILEWRIKKDAVLMPEKHDLWIRRWRIDLTLFLTGVVILVDLITLINTYLNGEISTRFVFKFLTILIILTIVFTYYILEKLDRSSKTKTTLAYVGIAVTLGSIIWGFVVVGSPTKQRNIKFDNQRINDLQSIQWQIVGHWQQKGKLPVALTDLADSISGQIIPTDPENKTQYEYIVKGAKSFELCASFALDSQDTKGRGDYISSIPYAVDMSYPSVTVSNNWEHKLGHVCFERTIDPDKYPVTPKAI